ENGLMSRLESRVKPYTQTGGLLDNRNTALQSTIADVRDQREALERRTASLESRLLAQFTAMDSMVGQLMGTSNYLTGILDSLPGVVKKSKYIMKSPIDTCKQVNLAQEVSQYRAVQLLLNGAIERLKLARHAQETGNPERRGTAVSSTISIIGALQASLDKELGGE